MVDEIFQQIFHVTRLVEDNLLFTHTRKGEFKTTKIYYYENKRISLFLFCDMLSKKDLPKRMQKLRCECTT